MLGYNAALSGNNIRRFGTTYPSHLQLSRSRGRLKFFLAHPKRQKGTEETVQRILNLGTRCRFIVTVLHCSGEKVAGKHCEGPVVVHKGFLGVLEETKIFCPCYESNHESLFVGHADQPLHRTHRDDKRNQSCIKFFLHQFFLPPSCFH